MSSDTKTTPVRRNVRRRRRRVTMRPAAKKLLRRKNCFGLTEHVDLKSAAEVVANEERFNNELEAFLDGVAAAGTRRTSKKFLEQTFGFTEKHEQLEKKTKRPSKKNK